MPAPVALVCAMPVELRPLTKRLGLRKTSVGGVALRSGTHAGQDVVGIVTGMGTQLAQAGIERLLAAVTPAHVLVVGITGAVEDHTPIGALIQPERVVNSETNEEFRPHRLGDATPHGTLWTTNVITPPEELPALRARGVVALDMETAALAKSCEARGIPWSVFRTVSDRATEGSLDDGMFGLINQDGTARPGAVVRYVLRYPHRIPKMASLGKDVKLATERAADAAIAALAHVRGT